ncbi:hypothetical protein D7V97_05750 [Corallococcus sp. CA053C]|nr:hypothetical protein D7V97_05750 [Corallococcus sp. CA053C]
MAKRGTGASPTLAESSTTTAPQEAAMDTKPKPSPPPRKRHGDVLDGTLRKSDLSGEEDATSPKREGQQQQGTEAPQEPNS